MVKVKVANPGPAALMVFNGRKTMTKRRKSTRRKARRTVHAVSNTPRRHRAKRRSFSLVRRAHNPPFRRRRTFRSRRRNPAGGLLTKGLTLAAGAALVQFTLGFVPPIGGVTPLADAARTAAVGWGLGLVMDKSGIGRKWAGDVMLAGFTLAGGKVITSFILPFANRLFRPPPPPANGNGNGQAQLYGMAPIHQGMHPYGAYSSLGGLAMIDPGLQPYGEYAGY